MQDFKIDRNFKISCQAKEITPLIEKIFLLLQEKAALSEDLKFNLEIAAREMLGNAIEHGCSSAKKNNKDLSKLKIEIDLEINKELLKFTVTDPGSGFDWENYDLEKMTKFEEKGRGLKMINKVCDQMIFNTKGNKVTAKFKL